MMIECEHVTTQTPANCSFKDGPYHPCENTSSIHFAHFNIDMCNTFSASHTATGTLPLILNSAVSPPGKHSVVIVANNDDVLVAYRINETLKPAGKNMYVLLLLK